MSVDNKLPLKLSLSLAAVSLIGITIWAYEAYRSAAAMAGLVWLVFPIWAGVAITVGFASGWLIGTAIVYLKARRLGLDGRETRTNKPLVYVSILVVAVAILYGGWSANDLRLRELVYRSSTTPQKLDELSRSIFVRRSGHLEEYLAKNPSTGTDALARLYSSERVTTRRRVCEHMAVSPEVLARCATESDASVLGSVAKNPKTPADVVNRLSQHSSYSVRMSIGFRRDIGPDILNRFSRDQHEEVRGSILYHPRLPAEVLARLASDPSTKVRVRVAANKKTPLLALLKLARDPDHTVRWALLWDDAPRQVLELLANDPQDRVQHRAHYLLRKKAAEVL